VVIVVLGVSGAGKTTVGSLLAQDMGWEFADADDFHSPENIAKMRNGIPLTDEDRVPWLASLRSRISEWIVTGKNAVLACSALKDAYRAELSVSDDVRMVYLKLSRAVLLERLRLRHGHYMKPEMLTSQLEALQEPHDALLVDADQTPAEIVEGIRRGLELG
jgi:gluconokinase